MKTKVIIMMSLFISLFLTGCEKELVEVPGEVPGQLPPEGKPSDLPDGYFEVTFSAGYGGGDTRTPVTGTDSRVRHLRYVIYKSTGEFVKEKVVLNTTDAAPSWPMAALKDTLPKGQYTAVFLANVSFSDTSAQPYVLLQRIISMLNLRRVFVDAQTALNSLTNNIVTQVGYKNIIRTTVQGILPGLLKTAMNLGPVGNLVYDVVGGLDAAVNLVVAALVEPVVDALYAQLLQGLVNQIGLTLSGNATQNGALGALGDLLNPWRGSDAAYALVTINNFPKTMDLDLNVKDFYTGNHRFRYGFTSTPGTTNSEKDILIRGFHGLYDVREIHVAKPGLISGLLVDDVIDGPLLLNGVFVNITDPIQATVNTNYRYRSNYSFVSLGLKSYAQQSDGNHSLTLSVQLKNIANLDGILGGIPVLGPVLNGTVRLLIGNITVTVPVNLPLLGTDNLTLSGSWSTPPVQY